MTPEINPFSTKAVCITPYQVLLLLVEHQAIDSKKEILRASSHADRRTVITCFVEQEADIKAALRLEGYVEDNPHWLRCLANLMVF